MNLFALSPVLLLVAILPRETPFGAAQPAPAQPTETRRAELSERATPLAEPDAGSGETLTLPDPTWKFSEIFTFDLGDHFCENNLAIADFDGDGDNDIAVLATRYSPGAWARKLVILHQGPDWTFTETLLAEYDNYGYAVAAGDLDGNETADLVVRAWPGTRVYPSDGREASGRAGVDRVATPHLP